MTEWKWPSREEWAKRRRKAYWDAESPHPYTASRVWSDYMTSKETAVIVTMLKRRYRDLGRQMGEAKREIGPRCEEIYKSSRLYGQLPPEQRKTMGLFAELRYRRRTINRPPAAAPVSQCGGHCFKSKT